MNVVPIPDFCEINAVEHVLRGHLRSLPRSIITELLTAARDARIKLDERKELESLARDWMNPEIIHHEIGCEWCTERLNACIKLENDINEKGEIGGNLLS